MWQEVQQVPKVTLVNDVLKCCSWKCSILMGTTYEYAHIVRPTNRSLIFLLGTSIIHMQNRCFYRRQTDTSPDRGKCLVAHCDIILSICSNDFQTARLISTNRLDLPTPYRQ